MTGKPWYASKTIWINLLFFVALLLPEFMALPALAGIREELAVLLTTANVALRFVTDRPVEVARRQ